VVKTRKTESAEQRAMTVLIVEDEPAIMQLMNLLTSTAGYRVIAARDGHEALFLWESERPAMIFMDVKLPNLDGLEATRRIRAREKEIGGEVPIYALTALVLEEDVNCCLFAGMTGHIGKPIDFQEVRETLRRHCISGVKKAEGLVAPPRFTAQP
jgi:CheY-like chemotaxis protein